MNYQINHIPIKKVESSFFFSSEKRSIGFSEMLSKGSAGSYRFGFQGQEVDNEIKGNGNSVNYKYRMHDPRIGRFFAVDPLAGQYPHNSPYAFSENVVINAVELEGLEKHVVISPKNIFNVLHVTSTYELGLISYERYQKFMNYYIAKDKGTYTKRIVENSPKDYVIHYNTGTFYSDMPTTYVNAPKSEIKPKASRKSKWEWLHPLFRPGGMEGNENPTAGSDVTWEQGQTIMIGTIGFIFTGGTIAAGGSLGWGILSMSMSFDDMTTQADQTTLMSEMTGLSPENVNKIKIGVNVASFSKTGRGLMKEFLDPKNAGKAWTSKQKVDFFSLLNDELNGLNGATKTAPKK